VITIKSSDRSNKYCPLLRRLGVDDVGGFACLD
jgi:hypothetical protein